MGSDDDSNDNNVGESINIDEITEKTGLEYINNNQKKVLDKTFVNKTTHIERIISLIGQDPSLVVTTTPQLMVNLSDKTKKELEIIWTNLLLQKEQKNSLFLGVWLTSSIYSILSSKGIFVDQKFKDDPDIVNSFAKLSAPVSRILPMSFKGFFKMYDYIYNAVQKTGSESVLNNWEVWKWKNNSSPVIVGERTQV